MICRHCGKRITKTYNGWLSLGYTEPAYCWIGPELVSEQHEPEDPEPEDPEPEETTE